MVNEITGITGGSWAVPDHDARGNMTTVPKPNDPANAFTCKYDAWGKEKGTLLVFTCYNVTALVDAATGEVVERSVYDPYGRVAFLDSAWQPSAVPGRSYWAVSACGNEVLFAGYRHDWETGLYQVNPGQSILARD